MTIPSISSPSILPLAAQSPSWGQRQPCGSGSRNVERLLYCPSQRADYSLLSCLPLPCLLGWRRTSPDKLIIGQTPACDSPDYRLETASILIFPLVESECFLIEIPEQVEWFDIDVSTANGPLQQAPEVLNSIGVNVPLDVSLSVVNDFMNVLPVQVAVGRQRIGDEVATGLNRVADGGRDCSAAGVSYYLGLYLARLIINSMPFEQAHDGNLADCAATSVEPPPGVLVLFLTANEGLVSFDGARELTVTVSSHSQPDSVKHKPSGLLSYVQSAGDFIGRNPVLGITDKPNGGEPLTEWQRAVLEDSAYFDSELPIGVARTTLKTSLPFEIGYLLRTAARTNRAIQPANLSQELLASLFVSEINNSLLQCPRGQHFIHHEAILAHGM